MNHFGAVDFSECQILKQVISALLTCFSNHDKISRISVELDFCKGFQIYQILSLCFKGIVKLGSRGTFYKVIDTSNHDARLYAII